MRNCSGIAKVCSFGPFRDRQKHVAKSIRQQCLGFRSSNTRKWNLWRRALRRDLGHVRRWPFPINILFEFGRIRLGLSIPSRLYACCLAGDISCLGTLHSTYILLCNPVKLKQIKWNTVLMVLYADISHRVHPFVGCSFHSACPTDRLYQPGFHLHLHHATNVLPREMAHFSGIRGRQSCLLLSDKTRHCDVIISHGSWK